MKSWRQTGMTAPRDVMGRGSIGVFEAMSIMNTAPISLLAERPRMVSVRLSELSFQELWNCARAGVSHVAIPSDSVNGVPLRLQCVASVQVKSISAQLVSPDS